MSIISRSAEVFCFLGSSHVIDLEQCEHLRLTMMRWTLLINSKAIVLLIIDLSNSIMSPRKLASSCIASFLQSCEFKDHLFPGSMYTLHLPLALLNYLCLPGSLKYPLCFGSALFNFTWAFKTAVLNTYEDGVYTGLPSSSHLTRCPDAHLQHCLAVLRG